MKVLKFPGQIDSGDLIRSGFARELCEYAATSRVDQSLPLPLGIQVDNDKH